MKLYYPKEAIITVEKYKKPNYLFYGITIGEKIIDLCSYISLDKQYHTFPLDGHGKIYLTFELRVLPTTFSKMSLDLQLSENQEEPLDEFERP